MSDTGLGPLVALDKTNSENEITSKTNSTKTADSDLDKDAFLKLLVTQLQYQDPLNPMDNTEFIAQTAQFTALEQMQNLNVTMTKSQAFAMIGRQVDTLKYDETTGNYEQISGTVDSVTMKTNEPYLVVGDKEIKYSEVKNVYETVGGINQSMAVSQAMSLIGKTIQAITFDNEDKDNPKPKEFVEGTVDHVKFMNGSPILSVNGKDVEPYEVLSVSKDGMLKGKQVKVSVYNDEISDYEIVSGIINDIKINNDDKDYKVYITVNNKDVEIKNVSTLVDALSYVGKEIKSKDISGIVDSVLVRNTKTYLLVGEKEVDFEKFMSD